MNWIKESFDSYQKSVTESNLMQSLGSKFTLSVHNALQADIDYINNNFIKEMQGEGAELKLIREENEIEIRLLKNDAENLLSNLSFHYVEIFYLTISFYKLNEVCRKQGIPLRLNGSKIVPVLEEQWLTAGDISRLSLIRLFHHNAPSRL